mgnify:CR=1 FL=1
MPEEPEGRFIYGVFLSDGGPPFTSIGLGDRPVFTIPYQDIAVLVSAHPVTKVKPLRQNLSPYHRVVHEAAKSRTTIPARFGQIAPDEEELLRVICRGYPRIKAELNRLHNKVEMGVQVFWEVDNIFEYLVRQYRALGRLRDSLLGRATPLTRQEQFKFGELLHDRLLEMREVVSQKVKAVLKGAAVEVKLEEATQEKMAMNGFFLIMKEKQKDFEQRAEEASQLLGEDYRLKVDGPWVPFNFVERIELGL